MIWGPMVSWPMIFRECQLRELVCRPGYVNKGCNENLEFSGPPSNTGSREVNGGNLWPQRDLDSNLGSAG